MCTNLWEDTVTRVLPNGDDGAGGVYTHACAHVCAHALARAIVVGRVPWHACTCARRQQARKTLSSARARAYMLIFAQTRVSTCKCGTAQWAIWPYCAVSYLSNNCISHNYISHHYISHNCISHNYISHSYGEGTARQ